MEEKKYRKYCFTLNNYTEEEVEHIKSLDGNKQVRYLIAGKEMGDVEHTPHLQGFIVFHNAKTFAQTKTFLGERYHIEKCKGNTQQNIAYCSKENTFLEFGEPPKQGSREDIEHVKKQINEGVPICDIINNATSYQSARHAELLMKYQKSPPPFKRMIKWYYGEAGSGKTREAIDEAKGDYYMSMRDLKWWDGYYGQSCIIIDDFRKDFCTFHELLRIIDRYPYRVNTKGSSMWFQLTTKQIIITSCYHPKDVYETREDIQQLLRRIDIIREFKIKEEPFPCDWSKFDCKNNWD